MPQSSGSSKSPSFLPPVEKVTEEEAQALMLGLRRKQGGWIAWGRACEALQKSGYTAQSIFEETGFEATHQLQVSVGAQVYDSLVQENAPESTLECYQQRGSDVLYELRQLDHCNRLKAAQYCLDRNLDMDEARLVAKDFREMQWLATLPSGFENDPGDAVAYFCWKRARARRDLQERSRLIAQGLRHAQSDSARERLQQLLSDFTVVSDKKAPLLPLYRLEQEEQLPRLIPVAGTYPLSLAQLDAVPNWTETGAFRVVRAEQPVSWVALPGWQAVLRAAQPFAMYCNSEVLPNMPEGITEKVMLVLDRAATTWTENGYFFVEKAGELALNWFSEPPTQEIIGQLVVIVRPKRILDESIITAHWQLEE
ncbi:MAG: hypothetical protein HC771_09060 [Synechococcales cyanobacterium CRU_2_2]|nr:hypothetical protein [Synechococcales cyanobacterium CRU_2_2]